MEESLFLGLNVLFNFRHHLLSFFEVVFTILICLFKIVLFSNLLLKFLLSSLVLLFRCVKSLHLVFKSRVQSSYSDSLSSKIWCLITQLISCNSYFSFQVFSNYSLLAQNFSLVLDLSFQSLVLIFFLFVIFFASVEVFNCIFMFSFLFFQYLLVLLENFTNFLKCFVSLCWGLNCLSPFHIQIVSFNVQSFEFLSSLIKFNLSSLSFSYFFVKLLLFLGH